MIRARTTRTRALLASLATSMVAAGCYGGADGEDEPQRVPGAGDDDDDDDDADDDDDDDDDGPGPEGSDCEGSVSPLRRLSEIQYRNTLRDLVAPAGIDLEAEIPNDLERIPIDDDEGGFALLDTNVSELHVTAYYRIADSLSYLITEDDAYTEALLGGCAVGGTQDAECIDSIIDELGPRAYRRPLDDDERALLQSIAADSDNEAEAVRAVVFSLLMSPQFLYHVEVDGEGEDTQFEVGPYGLASRLSYHFWQTMPDDELFAAAADGSLMTEEGYAAQLDRVFDDPRTRAAVDRFYDEWLGLGWFTAFPNTPAFETFAEGTTALDEGADHLAAAHAEIHQLARYYTWASDGTISDLLLSDRSVTDSPHLAAIYGAPTWDGTGEPPAMPAGDRVGLLTRVAFLVTGDHETHPIYRGASVRRRILCEELPSPDPTALPDGALDPPPIDGEQTTRERYEAKTADATCQGCHALINPVGFVLERYDALGRLRDMERVIDEESGDVLADLEIDSRATFVLGDEEVEIDSGVQLSEMVAATGQVEGCFAKQYFRATFGRVETPDDACTVDRVRETLLEGGSLEQGLRAVAEDPMFRWRRVE